MLEPFGFDRYLLTSFTQQLPDYKWFFFAITQLGSPLTLAIVASLAFILGKNKLKSFAAILIIGMMFSVVIVEDVKDVFQRPRPEGANAVDFLIKGSYSFPSGHALSIFLAATVLGAYFGWRFYIAGYVMAIAVSLSRLYLGVHYPSDVLAGAAIGFILGELLIYAAYRLELCSNPGLLSYLLKLKFDKNKPVAWGNGPDVIMDIIIFLAIVLSIAAFFLNYAIIAIFLITAASLFIILYVARKGLQFDKNIVTSFTITSIVLIAALALLYLNSYILSLAIITVGYLAVISLPTANVKNLI
jgi:undecaprenyl-diphosphatase